MPERKTVLIAEDNEDNLIVYTTMLEHVGFRVVHTEDGSEVVQLAAEEKPAVILMDISLQGTDGWTATRELKQNPETAEIPVVAITARAFEEDREKSLEVGCAAYLAKPVEPRRVVEEVQRLLDEEEGGRAPAHPTGA